MEIINQSNLAENTVDITGDSDSSSSASGSDFPPSLSSSTTDKLFADYGSDSDSDPDFGYV